MDKSSEVLADPPVVDLVAVDKASEVPEALAPEGDSREVGLAEGVAVGSVGHEVSAAIGRAAMADS